MQLVTYAWRTGWDLNYHLTKTTLDTVENTTGLPVNSLVPQFWWDFITPSDEGAIEDGSAHSLTTLTPPAGELPTVVVARHAHQQARYRHLTPSEFAKEAMKSPLPGLPPAPDATMKKLIGLLTSDLPRYDLQIVRKNRFGRIKETVGFAYLNRKSDDEVRKHAVFVMGVVTHNLANLYPKDNPLETIKKVAAVIEKATQAGFVALAAHQLNLVDFIQKEYDRVAPPGSDRPFERFAEYKGEGRCRKKVWICIPYKIGDDPTSTTNQVHIIGKYTMQVGPVTTNPDQNGSFKVLSPSHRLRGTIEHADLFGKMPISSTIVDISTVGGKFPALLMDSAHYGGKVEEDERVTVTELGDEIDDAGSLAASVSSNTMVSYRHVAAPHTPTPSSNTAATSLDDEMETISLDGSG